MPRLVKISTGGVSMNIFTRNNFEKIGTFFRKNGFYIALFVCIVGLGVAAVFTFTQAPEEEQLAELPSTQPVQNVQVPNLSDEIAARPTVSPEPVPDEESAQTPEESPDVTKPKAQSTITLKNPLSGEIIRDFSIDKLVFNKTLNQWATHNGIDIKGNAGDEVFCALSGTISKLYTDPVSGSVIVIKHESGDSSLYAGVTCDAALEEGLRVNTGTKLGTLKTSPFEEFVGDHLHFEYMKGEDYLDPQKYMK